MAMMQMPQAPKRSALQGALIDGSIFLGVGLASYGAWLIYPPAGFIAFGVSMTALGLAASAAVSR